MAALERMSRRRSGKNPYTATEAIIEKRFPTAPLYDPYRFMEDDNSSPLEGRALSASPTRHDGWTADRQEAFLKALAACGCVRDACKAVGMSHVSAYALRSRPSAIAFRAAWDAALDHAMHRLEEAALSRALNGVARPVFYKGEQVGEFRHHDERLTMFLLRYRRRQRFGAWLDAPPPPNSELDDPMGHLDWHLDCLTDYGEAPTRSTWISQEGDGVNFGNFDDAPDAARTRQPPPQV
jgi:hypothetical protein